MLCLQYRCDWKNGQCRQTCPKPNGTPCNNGKGSCQCGTCVDIPPKCPPNPNACQTYSFNEASQKCVLTTKTCPQPPGIENSCRTVSDFTVISYAQSIA
jgi:hypothetical protein